MSSRFVGHVDAVEPALAGWVVDRQRPAQPVRFVVTIDRGLTFEVVAGRPRPDVTAAGFGGPNCGFELVLPAALLDGASHDIALTFADGEPLELAGWQSPAVLGPVAGVIAPLIAADHADIRAVLRQTHVEGNMEPAAITDRYVADWIGSATGAGGTLLFGARVKGSLVGYAMIERGRGAAASIGAVAVSVLRQYRRKGLGERLMRALLTGASHDREIHEVWLSVERQNLPARRLYEKLGFVDREEPPPSLVVPSNFLAMLWRTDGIGR
jgi:ribosomal protein S18 acetylase RimI-like enzyme